MAAHTLLDSKTPQGLMFTGIELLPEYVGINVRNWHINHVDLICASDRVMNASNWHRGGTPQSEMRPRFYTVSQGRTTTIFQFRLAHLAV